MISTLIAMTLAWPRVPASAESSGYRSAGLTFWRAVSSGDYRKLYYLYSDIVLVVDGSELLNRKWRVDVENIQYETRIVHRDDLLDGLAKLIKSVGRDNWRSKYGKISAERITFRYVSREHKPWLGNRPGDILMAVDTGSGSHDLVYVLRYVFNRWHVVMEYTRYL